MAIALVYSSMAASYLQARKENYGRIEKIKRTFEEIVALAFIFLRLTDGIVVFSDFHYRKFCEIIKISNF